MPSARSLLRSARHRGLPPSTRARLLAVEVERRLQRRAEYPVRLARVTVFLSHDDFEIDWKSLAFVAVDEAYAGDYSGAVVVDLGAHKGYFGAYALHHGAHAVVSYEPERRNFELLERAAQLHRDRGGRWLTQAAAVGAEAGEAELHVMGASWGHALHPPEEFARYEVGVQRVRLEPLAGVLDAVRTLAAGARIVVKVNIEGEECSLVLETPIAAWEGVSELYVETHPWAACDAEKLARHLEPSGLSRVESAHPAVLQLRR